MSNYSLKHGSDGGDSSNKDHSIRKQYEEQKDEKDNNVMVDGMQRTEIGTEDGNISEAMHMRGGGLCEGPDEEMKRERELEGQQKSETDEGTEDASKDVRKKQVSQEEQGEMGGVEEYSGSTEEAEAAQDGEDAKVDRALNGASGQRTLQPAAGGESKKRSRLSQQF